jgi:Na+-transporting NADH:ubiquinone oxidoreductase subunit NqrC
VELSMVFVVGVLGLGCGFILADIVWLKPLQERNKALRLRNAELQAQQWATIEWDDKPLDDKCAWLWTEYTARMSEWGEP